MKRIEREAIETLNKASSLITDDGSTTGSNTSAGRVSEHDSASEIDPPPNTVGKNENSPGAEIWGIGKSKL